MDRCLKIYIIPCRHKKKICPFRYIFMQLTLQHLHALKSATSLHLIVLYICGNNSSRIKTWPYAKDHNT